MTLHIVFKEARGTHGSKLSEPEKKCCFSPLFVDDSADGIVNHNRENADCGKNLNDADETVCGEKSRIISRTLDYKFRKEQLVKLKKVPSLKQR